MWHALVGKSTLAKNVGKCIDLESSIFCKGDFDGYAEKIISLHNQDKIVLTSCHYELRNILQQLYIPYVLVLPLTEEKERYMELSDNRQPHPLKTNIIDKFWDKWQVPLEKETIFYLPKGKHLQHYILYILENK